MKLKNQAKQVEAMKILLENYENKGFLNSCPLCKVTSCIHCVWVAETGATCVAHMLDYRHRPHPSYDLRNNSNKKWRKRRIKELKQWIKKYEVEK